MWGHKYIDITTQLFKVPVPHARMYAQLRVCVVMRSTTQSQRGRGGVTVRLTHPPSFAADSKV